LIGHPTSNPAGPSLRQLHLWPDQHCAPTGLQSRYISELIGANRPTGLPKLPEFIGQDTCLSMTPPRQVR
jgi:hypothetical protein